MFVVHVSDRGQRREILATGIVITDEHLIASVFAFEHSFLLEDVLTVQRVQGGANEPRPDGTSCLCTMH